MFHSSIIHIKTRGFSDIHDLTPSVRKECEKAGISAGSVTVFVPGSTAGITTIEFEEGALEDLKRAIERLVPRNIEYQHDSRWGDGNGFAHVRAALLGPSITIPVISGRLQLGAWQQVILVDFDNRPRSREVVVQIIGN